jgi:hypothetical protein
LDGGLFERFRGTIRLWFLTRGALAFTIKHVLLAFILGAMQPLRLWARESGLILFNEHH